MGQCISLVPAGETPTCKVCGKQASRPWKSLGLEERQRWVWEGKQACCRKCVVSKKLDQTRFQNERKRYAKAKEESYPKPTEGVKPIRRVGSGETWDSGKSFRSGWKPSSTLNRLVSAIMQAQQEEPGKYVGPQRKGTGFVPASCPPAATGGPLQQLQQAGATSGDQQQAQQAQQGPQEELWANLEEEYGVEQVTEEIIGLERPSVRGSTSFDRQTAFPVLQEVEEGEGEEEEEEGSEGKDDREGQAVAAAPAGQPDLGAWQARSKTPQLKSLQSKSRRLGESGAAADAADPEVACQNDSAYQQGEEASSCTVSTA